MERWMMQTKKADFAGIGAQFHMDPLVARVMRNRDIVGEDAIREYLHPKIENLNSPWLFKDMDKAVDLLQIKISQSNNIRIISDYDVDGICSGYILLRALRNIGANVDIVVPHRIEDGYGLNEKLVRKAQEEAVDTIITCDNGIAAAKEIAVAKELGMTVIVTDHHEVPFVQDAAGIQYTVPPADAVIDQKQPDCTYPYKELCGAMVAYQLMVALYDVMGRGNQELYALLPYAAIATVCDIVDLTGENRTVVKYGMESLRTCEDVGINALLDACGLDKEKITSYNFGYVLGPTLNATGRISSAKKAIDLLMTEDVDKAQRLAKELHSINTQRKEMTVQGTAQALEMAKTMEEKVLVIYLKDCHESVAGIIAGRVKDKYHKPTIVLTDGQDFVKGSARSIEAYNIYEELTKVKDLFLKFGGHKMAAGMSLEEKNIEILRKRLNENCNLTQEDLYLKVWIDSLLPFRYISMKLLEDIHLLEPFGKANPKPVFAQKGLKLMNLKMLGDGNTLKLTLQDAEHARMTAMVFPSNSQDFMMFLRERFGQEEIGKAMGGQLNRIEFMAIYSPRINEYNGRIELQVVLERFC